MKGGCAAESVRNELARSNTLHFEIYVIEHRIDGWQFDDHVVEAAFKRTGLLEPSPILSGFFPQSEEANLFEFIGRLGTD